MNRIVLASGLCATFMVGAACTSTGERRDVARKTVVTADTRAEMTPRDILTKMKRGNERFVSENLTPQDYRAQVRQTASGQYPMAVVLSCLDSRVIPEAAFDMGIGDLFVGRVAGNFENTDMLGSMEFATAVAGSKVIVVLGHSACGAVKGAIDGAELGNLTATLDNIEPAIETATRQGVRGASDSSNTAFVDAVVEANVRQTIRDILDRSDVLRGRVDSGQLLIVGGVYDLGSGRVDWLGG